MSRDATFAPDDPRWQAVLARDAGMDGAFAYAVTSTGIYCRPSCPSRKPKPENVRFHASAEGAEIAGFRPCKRCRPAAPAHHVDRTPPGLPPPPAYR